MIEVTDITAVLAAKPGLWLTANSIFDAGCWMENLKSGFHATLGDEAKKPDSPLRRCTLPNEGKYLYGLREWPLPKGGTDASAKAAKPADNALPPKTEVNRISELEESRIDRIINVNRTTAREAVKEVLDAVVGPAEAIVAAAAANIPKPAESSKPEPPKPNPYRAALISLQVERGAIDAEFEEVDRLRSKLELRRERLNVAIQAMTDMVQYHDA